MQIFRDSRADQIIVIQEAHPIIGWGVVVPLGVALVALGIWSGLVIAAAILAITAVFMLWLAAWVLTEIVATFDGKARSLTVRHERPWGSSSEPIDFARVYDLELTEVWAIDHTYPRFDIILEGQRRIRLRVNYGERQEAERALVDARGMLRRPAPSRAATG